MHRRSKGTVVAIKAILSAAIVLTVLFIWERSRQETPPAVGPATPPAEETPRTPAAPPTQVPTATSTATGTPPPLFYLVRQGDTLGAIAQTYDVSIKDLMAANNIADPNVLRAGQSLVIPGHAGPTLMPPPAPPVDANGEPAPTAPPSTLLPTLTPSGPPLVEIAQALGSGNPAAEVVVLRNRGGIARLDAWTLSDAAGNTFVFPPLILFTGAEVRVHTTAGRNTPRDLYWGRTAAAWEGGELITLRDAAGESVDTYIVP
jgi:LysM repeat protein